jgi:DNA-binding transcriptional ArsR family regulator
MSRTAVSKHLHVLADAGLVSEQKVGRETRFKLRPEPLLELKQWLSYYERFWDNKLNALKNLAETKASDS